mgnify:FL=1
MKQEQQLQQLQQLLHMLDTNNTSTSKNITTTASTPENSISVEPTSKTTSKTTSETNVHVKTEVKRLFRSESNSTTVDDLILTNTYARPRTTSTQDTTKEISQDNKKSAKKSAILPKEFSKEGGASTYVQN